MNGNYIPTYKPKKLFIWSHDNKSHKKDATYMKGASVICPIKFDLARCKKGDAHLVSKMHGVSSTLPCLINHVMRDAVGQEKTPIVVVAEIPI